MKNSEITPEDVKRRLWLASELRDLSLSLMRAKKDHDEKLSNIQTENAKACQAEFSKNPDRDS